MLRALCVLVAQSCPTLCDPVDCSPPGSSVHGIPQARRLEGAAIPFFGDLLDPGIEPGSRALQADSFPSEPPRKPGLCWQSSKMSFAGRAAWRHRTLLCSICQCPRRN